MVEEEVDGFCGEEEVGRGGCPREAVAERAMSLGEVEPVGGIGGFGAWLGQYGSAD